MVTFHLGGSDDWASNVRLWKEPLHDAELLLKVTAPVFQLLRMNDAARGGSHSNSSFRLASFELVAYFDVDSSK